MTVNELIERLEKIKDKNVNLSIRILYPNGMMESSATETYEKYVKSQIDGLDTLSEVFIYGGCTLKREHPEGIK